MHIMYPGIANCWIHGVSSASASPILHPPAAPMPLEVAADGRRSPASGGSSGGYGEAVGSCGAPWEAAGFPSEIAVFL